MFTIALITNIGFIGAGGGIIRFGLKHIQMYYKIQNLATSKIKSLAAGEVEIKGVILPNPKNPLLSPLKGEKCVSYNLKVYQWVTKHKNGSNWSLIHEKTIAKPFYLSDNTGYILVNPEGAIIKNDTFSSKESNQLLSEITKELKISPSTRPGKYLFEEIYIPEGENIYVLGYTVQNKNKTDNKNIQGLMIAKTEKKDFIITDEKEDELKKSYLINGLVFLTIGLFLVFFGLIQIFNIIDWINFMGDF